MRWDLHGLTIQGETINPLIRERWLASFASRPTTPANPDVAFAFNLELEVPPRPPGEAQFRQGDLLEYYVDSRIVVAHFPRFGQLRLDLARGTTEARAVAAALTTYGVFEDLVAIGLSPHLRRRGLFLIHAFAAAGSDRDPLSLNVERRAAALLVGGIGSGKTTTGMSLLNAGWKLLSNDSPIINASTEVLSYPGLLAAYPVTFTRFGATAHLADSTPNVEGRPKVTIAAESIWLEVWIDRARAGAIFLPQIEPRSVHVVEPIGSPEALRRLLPHAVEQWDREMIPEHLRVLKNLVESAPAYILRLSPDVLAIPSLLVDVIHNQSFTKP